MPIYDMYCPRCKEDRGEKYFKTFRAYDDLNNRGNCPECKSTLEKKAFQHFNILDPTMSGDTGLIGDGGIDHSLF